ncbi:hypothetical protein [Maricaulis sp. W15]|uniref:hypothetical protein n=1 Tax=Maricaulis sp. W15 TaxID=1772333 RepID=UPI001180D9A9|nr:hypothetical protein [Maricaulis sp. W15]
MRNLVGVVASFLALASCASTAESVDPRVAESVEQYFQLCSGENGRTFQCGVAAMEILVRVERCPPVLPRCQAVLDDLAPLYAAFSYSDGATDMQETPALGRDLFLYCKVISPWRTLLVDANPGFDATDVFAFSEFSGPGYPIWPHDEQGAPGRQVDLYCEEFLDPSRDCLIC